MAVTYLSRFLAEQRANERRMAALFNGLAISAMAELMRYADVDGAIPRSATFEIQRAVGERVTNLFLGRTSNGQRVPFQILPNGVVLPISPYARALWTGISNVVRIPVEQQAELMRRRVPPTILARMQTATRDPFAVAAQVAEMNGSAPPPIAEQIFRPNPLARYEAPHTWVDPNGYTLSDRIWNTAGNTRRRLDMFIDEAVREGRGALAISRDLETFLAPGRALKRTKAPYGTDASYDAMRLARTEITSAHSRAFEAAAAMNPFVQGKKWVLSRSHPKPDICDDRAAGGENGDGIYPLDSDMNIPGDSHPHCLCHWNTVMVDNPDVILDDLQADLKRTRAELVDIIGPLLVDRFTQLLVSGSLEVTRAIAPATGL